MKTHVLTSLSFAVLSFSSALASPLTAPVVHKIGPVNASCSGGVVPAEVGRGLPEKSGLKIGPAAEVAFDPFPGSSVLVTEKSDASIQRIEFERQGEHVRKRAATLGLDAGRLFYSIEKFKPAVTQFQVITPGRIVSVRAKVTKPNGVDSAGMVEIVDKSLLVTVLSGSAEVSGQGGTITVGEGCVLTAGPAGAGLLNLIDGQVTMFDASGGVVETRAANPQEILAGRSNFQVALSVAEQAIATASLGADVTAAIGSTVAQINRDLTANGLAALTLTAAGAAAPQTAGFEVYSGLGMPAAQTVNPANITGVVRSGER